MRRKTRNVKVGGLFIGSDHPISIQSMVNVPAQNTDAVLSEIERLSDSGCDIVRLAVPDEGSASVFSYARERGIKTPLVADIHFDHKLALLSVASGADKIRINPGNIGAEWKIREVAEACRASGIPIRIGVNSGSVGAKILEKYGGPTAGALAESALSEAESLEKYGFSDIVISIKSSSVPVMTEAVSIVAEKTDYPLHIGVTEAGDEYDGLIKNSVGIGALISRGIGDTVRVSLTADPVAEVEAAKKILSALGVSSRGGINVISCPTCGRTKIDLLSVVNEYKKRIKGVDTHGKQITAAVMGCAVNGPGEAREADFGVAGGDGFALFFVGGVPVEKIPEDGIVDKLVEQTLSVIEKG